MISLGDARRARPPAWSRRARRRIRRGRLPAHGPAAPSAPDVVAAAPPPHEDDVPAARHVVAATPPPEDDAPAEREVLVATGGATATVAGPDGQPARPVAGVATMTLTVDPAPPPSDAGEPLVEADDRPPGSPGTRSAARNALEWVVIIGAALLAAVLIKTYLLQAFYIPSSSMEPTLEIQDRVLVNKLSYRLHDVHRGDVVVFERPPNDVGQIRDLIKRVIGLPGETVEGRDGTVYVNGRPLREPYLPSGAVTAQFGPEDIPAGYIWVMGDNRGNSSDSRVFGAVSESRIVGRAFVRVWPINALGLL